MNSGPLSTTMRFTKGLRDGKSKDEALRSAQVTFIRGEKVLDARTR